MRQQEINEQAQLRSEMCTEQTRDIYRIVFREGAEWADESRYSFLPKDIATFKVERNEGFKMTEKFREWLMNAASVGKCILAKNDEDGEVLVLDPDICKENDYQILNDCDSLNTLIILNIA